MNTREGGNKRYEYTVLAYARDVTHSQQMLMEDLIEACHKLYKKRLPLWDQMYMLKVVNYGELQRAYRNKEMKENNYV
jgi:hypothetical protein